MVSIFVPNPLPLWFPQKALFGKAISPLETKATKKLKKSKYR